MRSKFNYNDLVIVTEPIIISSCNSIIEKGDRGRVIDVDPDNGDITIRVGGYRPDLNCRNNCIYLSASEAVHKIKLANSRALTFKTASKLIAATAALCTMLTILANRESDGRVMSAMSEFHEATTATVTSAGCRSHGDERDIFRPRESYNNSIYSAKFDPVAAVNDYLLRAAAD